jgi:hypothetical protein
MTVLKYIREGILVVLYYLINCAIGVVNLMALVYNLFQFKRTDQKTPNGEAIA